MESMRFSLRRESRVSCQVWGRVGAGEGDSVAETEQETSHQHQWALGEQTVPEQSGRLNLNSKRLGGERGCEEGRETDWLAFKPEFLLKVFLPQQATVSFKTVMKLSWNSTQNSLGLYYTFLKNIECSGCSLSVLVHALLLYGCMTHLLQFVLRVYRKPEGGRLVLLTGERTLSWAACCF